MRLLFKQRLFSWFDTYDVYDENGRVLYVVKGHLSWGHKLAIHDAYGKKVGMVVERIITFFPKFDIYKNGSYEGCLSKEFSLLTPRYNIDYKGWHIAGSVWEWDYRILDKKGKTVATISKQLLRLTDTYVIDVRDPADALDSLMVVLAIDAEKCSREKKKQ